MAALRVVTLAAFALALALVVHVHLARYDCTLDDAYISFCYARNLARGHGLVFNPGERVWGFTSPLQVAVLGVAAFTGADVPLAAVDLSALWLALSVIPIYLLLKPVLDRRLAAAVALVFVSWPGAASWLGMESCLFVLLLLAFLAVRERGTGTAAAFVASAACLTRPDAVLLVVPLLLATRAARTSRGVAAFAGPGLVWLAFAWGYYGDVLPHSLYSKRGTSAPDDYFVEAATYFLNAQGPFTLALALGTSLCGGVELARRGRPALAYAFTVYPWVLVGAYSALGSFRSHWWEIHAGHAFFVLGIAACIAFVLEERPRLVLALAAVVIAANTVRFAGEVRSHRSAYNYGARLEAYGTVGRWACAHLPGTATLGATEVGILGWTSERRVVDLFGIVTLAESLRARAEPLHMIVQHKPDYLVTMAGVPSVTLKGGIAYKLLQTFPRTGYGSFVVMERQR